MKYPGKFMESLGHYQYGYFPGGVFDITVTPQYFGKGVKNRCLDHLKEKDVTTDDLVIIGRNLEKYTEEESAINAVQFALESLSINVLNPELNRVAGRYDETWCKMKLDDLYNEWLKEQINPFEEQMKFYNAHPEIHEFVKGTRTTGNTFWFYAPRVNGIENKLAVTPEVDGFVPAVVVNFSKDKKDELLQIWTEANPDVKYVTNGEQIAIEGLSVEEAIELWTATYE